MTREELPPDDRFQAQHSTIIPLIYSSRPMAFRDLPIQENVGEPLLPIHPRIPVSIESILLFYALNTIFRLLLRCCRCSVLFHTPRLHSVTFLSITPTPGAFFNYIVQYIRIVVSFVCYPLLTRWTIGLCHCPNFSKQNEINLFRRGKNNTHPEFTRNRRR